jgi:uncharacterized OB-fold protein
MSEPHARHAAETAPFWKGINDGKLMLQRCKSCGGCQFYPRAHCAACWSRDLAWEQMSGRGTVHTFSVVHRAINRAFEGLVPYIVILVDLDEGPRLTSHLVGSAPDAVHIGMRVKLRCARLVGETILPLFEPELR